MPLPRPTRRQPSPFRLRSKNSVRRPLLPDLSLILSSSIPLSFRLDPISDTQIAHHRRPTLQASTTLHRQQLHIPRAAHSRSPVSFQYSPQLDFLPPFQDVLFHINLTVERSYLRLTLGLAVARIETICILVFNPSRLALTRDIQS